MEVWHTLQEVGGHQSAGLGRRRRRRDAQLKGQLWWDLALKLLDVELAPLGITRVPLQVLHDLFEDLATAPVSRAASAAKHAPNLQTAGAALSLGEACSVSH